MAYLLPRALSESLFDAASFKSAMQRMGVRASETGIGIGAPAMSKILRANQSSNRTHSIEKHPKSPPFSNDGVTGLK